MGDAEITASSWKLVEVGRVILLSAGSYSGRLAVIVEIIDHKRVRHHYEPKPFHPSQHALFLPFFFLFPQCKLIMECKSGSHTRAIIERRKGRSPTRRTLIRDVSYLLDHTQSTTRRGQWTRGTSVGEGRDRFEVGRVCLGEEQGADGEEEAVDRL